MQPIICTSIENKEKPHMNVSFLKNTIFPWRFTISNKICQQY